MVDGQFITECPSKLNEPKTSEGRQIWRLLLASMRQLRLSAGGVVGLDYTAVFQLAQAMGIRRALIADILPAFETYLTQYYRGGSDDGGDSPSSWD